MTEKLYPAAFVWTEITDNVTGELIMAMVPRPHFDKQCRHQFVVGIEYVLDIHDRGNPKFHGYYFASINKAWTNLNETDKRFPSSEYLRKWALVQTGWANEDTQVWDNEEEAKIAARTIRARERYAVITRKENVVKVWTALSQSARNMSEADFKQSARDVLDCIAAEIGVKRGELEKQARSNA